MNIVIVFMVALADLHCDGRYHKGRYNRDLVHEELTDEGVECHGVLCSPGTTECTATKEQDTNDENWSTTVECMDEDGNILDTFITRNKGKSEGARKETSTGNGGFGITIGGSADLFGIGRLSATGGLRIGSGGGFGISFGNGDSRVPSGHSGSGTSPNFGVNGFFSANGNAGIFSDNRGSVSKAGNSDSDNFDVRSYSGKPMSSHGSKKYAANGDSGIHLSFDGAENVGVISDSSIHSGSHGSNNLPVNGDSGIYSRKQSSNNFAVNDHSGIHSTNYGSDNFAVNDDSAFHSRNHGSNNFAVNGDSRFPSSNNGFNDFAVNGDSGIHSQKQGSDNFAVNNGFGTNTSNHGSNNFATYSKNQGARSIFGNVDPAFFITTSTNSSSFTT